MTTVPEESDDYGYDLAHEAQEALRIPVARRHGAGAPMGTGRQVDQDGDLGYDDAHEIPVSDRPYRG
jgi:hypothetical protein